MHRYRVLSSIVIGSILFPLSVIAQAPAPAPPAIVERVSKWMNPSTGAWTAEQIAAMGKLRDAALSDDYAYRELQHLTNNIGPRLSGSPQAQAAVEYVASEMRAMGAQVQLEKVMVPHWVRGVESAELTAWAGGTPGTTQKIVVTALGGSPGTGATGLRGQLVVAHSFEEVRKLEQSGAAKGKVVLLNHPFDTRLAAQGHGDQAYGEAVAYRGSAPEVALRLQAKAVLVRSVGGADYRIPHTGYTAYTEASSAIPAAAITAEDADLIDSLLKQGPVETHLTLTCQNLAPAESANVVADWKGTEHPEQIVIVSGHLDSWDLGTGAIDDGAGVAVAMQAMHLIKKLGLHPKRTLRFVAWMDEESGASGGQAYAKEHVAEIPQHVGAIESDLGAGHPSGVQFLGKPELGDWIRPAAATLEPIGAASTDKVADAGTDIGFVTDLGVPGLSPAQDSRFYFNYHHTPADTLDKVNPRELAENAAVMSVLAYALADAAQTPPR